jgi:type IV secretory pathway TraG/TraD family ATPase VirD4
MRAPFASSQQKPNRNLVTSIDITGWGNRFDPLEGRITERELYSAAHQLLHNPNDKETYFTERATKMLTQLFLAAREETRLARLAYPSAKEIRPLPFVAQLVTRGLNQVASKLNRISPRIANAFLEAEYTPFKDFEESKSRADAWTTLSSRLYPILTDDIVRSFDGSDFTAKDLLFSKEPITVYFCWPEAELSSLTPLVRLVWESLMYDLITTFDVVNGVGCHDVLLSLDEAGRTGLSQLPELAATVNGRGISISMSGQSFEQFKSLYGEYRAKSLLNNMDTQIYHRQASFDTARDLSGWLGYKSGWASSQSKHGEAAESEGKQEREIPLLTARQIAELSDDEILILHRNIPPVRAQRFNLQAFPALAKRLHIDPPPLPALAAPGEYPRFPLWNRRLVSPGQYRLAHAALGYPIPLPASQ